MRVGLRMALIGGAVALTVGACGGAAENKPAPAAPVASAPAADAKPAADTLALGKVLDKGQPKAGIKVVAVAWPKSEVLDQMKAGADVQTKVVAEATTDAAGAFLLRVKPSYLSDLYVEEGGDVQIELFVGDQSGPSWDFTATQSDTGWSTSDAEDGKGRPFEAVLEPDPVSGELKVKRLDASV
jgi:hypothetical protein